MAGDGDMQPAGATLSGQMHSPRRKRKTGSAISSEGLPSASGARPRASAHLQPALSPRNAPAPGPPEAPAKEYSNAAGRGPEPAAEEAEPGTQTGQAAVNDRMPARAHMRKGIHRTAGGCPDYTFIAWFFDSWVAVIASFCK